MANKKQKRKIKKVDPSVSKIKSILFKSRDRGVNFKLNLRVAKSLTPLEDFPKLFNLSSSLSIKENNKDYYLPKSISEIKKHADDAFNDNEKNLAWYTLVLIKYSDLISEFLKIEGELEKCIFLDNYQEALNKIDLIDKNICHSIWGCEKRITITNSLNGLKEQKALTTEIKNEATDLVSALCHFYSCRTEEKVTPQWFKNTVNNISKELDEDYKNYIRLKLYGSTDFGDNNLLNLIALDSTSSIIDLYLTYVRALQFYVTNYNNQTTINKRVICLIDNLNKKVDDYRIKNILLCIGDVKKSDIHMRINPKKLFIIEEYIKGNSKNALNSSIEFLQNDPCDIDALEIYCKCLIRENIDYKFESNLKGRISKSLVSIFLRDDNFSKSITNINKICLLYSDYNFSYDLKSILYRELNSIKGKYTEVENIGLLNKKYITPKTCSAIHEDSTLKTICECIDELNFPNVVNTYIALYTQDEFLLDSELIPDYRRYSLKALNEFHNGNYTVSKDFFSKAYKCNDTLTSSTIVPYYIKSLLKSDSLIEALSLTVKTYLENPQSHIILPIKECCEELGLFDWPKTLDVPIILYMYTEHISKDKIELMRFSFENFLNQHNFKLPSEASSSTIKKEKLIYFFENICTYEVMKRFPRLKSTNDIDKERISIFNKLRDINEINSEKYLNEIRDLTKRIVVKEGIKKVGQSKIYVDTENIKSELKSEVAEYFDRYKALAIDNALSDEQVKFIDLYELTRVFSEQNTNYNRTVENLLANSLSDDDILITILRKVFYEFLKGEFGLNSFLSSRIRHGTLLNTLSKPLLSENLLTYIDNESGGYSKNEFWYKKSEKIDRDKKDRLIELISNFSSEFHGIIEHIKTKKIQIHVDNTLSNSPKDNFPEALFSFGLTNNDFIDIMSAISNDMDYESLMIVLFDHFWQLVEVQLTNARDYIENNVSTEINKLFEKHIKIINKEFKSNEVAELIGSLNRARIGVSSHVNEVVQWLHRQESNEVNDFTLNIPLDIAVKMITGFDGNNQFQISESIDEELSIKGKYLIYFVDIFYPLIDNVIQRSGLPPEQRKISIEANEDIQNQRINFTITSSVFPSNDIDSRNKKLEQKIHEHMQDQSPQVLTQEGGSGFYKIIKTIKNSLKSTIYNISAKFINETEFQVCIIFDSRGLKS
ncbi:TPA: hypothetical protein ACX6O4_001362 [Photobacterium damselae]